MTKTRLSQGVFALPVHLSAKATPELIAADGAHLELIEATLARTVADLGEHLDSMRHAPAVMGHQALDRDLEIHRVGARLRALRRFGADVCLGRMVFQEPGADVVHVGRFGLTDRQGRQLLIDWRTPAAEPFFAATQADPMGLTSRRRYRWNAGRVVDYWDEAFAVLVPGQRAALDDQSAFIASLGSDRSPKMRDVLTTIAADQSAIIRADSHGALVVEGGPGTGKTVVALHRAAYLLYTDPRLGHRRGGVLVVGPHHPYLGYVGDVLPSLGEEGVSVATIEDLVPEGTRAGDEPDPAVAALKQSVELVRAIEPAVAFYERPPTEPTLVRTAWADLTVSTDDWADAFAAPAPGTAHNEAPTEILDELVAILTERLTQHLGEQRGGDVPAATVDRALRRNEDLLEGLRVAWPIIEPTDLVGDLWTVPAYLRLCAPWLPVEDLRRCQRADPHAWTRADLPFLDAARARLGDPSWAARARRRHEQDTARRDQYAEVIDDILATDDDGEGAVTMLRGADLRDALADDANPELPQRDPLAGPFAHIVVDEAQELTDAQWQMLIARCPTRSFTIVGDRAQARHGFTETWRERLARVGLDRVVESTLTINYRTPAEIMAAAEPVIRAAVPDANVPLSIRPGGRPVVRADPAELGRLLDDWSAESERGTACVVTADPRSVEATIQTSKRSSPDGDRIRVLAPESVKGLEFDLVIVVEPDAFGTGIEGAVDRYVAMTRATAQLVILDHG